MTNKSYQIVGSQNSKHIYILEMKYFFMAAQDSCLCFYADRYIYNGFAYTSFLSGFCIELLNDTMHSMKLLRVWYTLSCEICLALPDFIMNDYLFLFWRECSKAGLQISVDNDQVKTSADVKHR